MGGLLDVLGLPPPPRVGSGLNGLGNRAAGDGGSAESVPDCLFSLPAIRAEGGAQKLDLRVEKIEEIIGDPERRLKELADRKLPRFSREFDAESKETAFLKDLESGTKRAKEYVEFVQKASEYAQKFGDFTASEQIKSVASNLKKVTSGVLSGLSKFAEVVDKVDKLVKFYHALDAFADSSLTLNMRDRASVTAWAKSIKTLWNATAPFFDWAKSKAITAVFAGSEFASVVATTLSVVGAQIFVGIEALNAGLANVNLYIDNLQNHIQKNVNPPPRPEPPAAWKSRGDEAAEARQREDDELRNDVYRQIRVEDAEKRQKADDEREAADAKRKADGAKKRAEEQAAAHATTQVEADFRDDFFPAKWVKSLREPLRLKLRRDLVAEYRANGQRDGHASDCYDCFEGSGEEDIGGDIYISKAVGRVGIDGAKREIANFTRLSTCDDFGRVAAVARKMFDSQRAEAAKK